MNFVNIQKLLREIGYPPFVLINLVITVVAQQDQKGEKIDLQPHVAEIKEISKKRMFITNFRLSPSCYTKYPNQFSVESIAYSFCLFIFLFHNLGFSSSSVALSVEILTH